MYPNSQNLSNAHSAPVNANSLKLFWRQALQSASPGEKHPFICQQLSGSNKIMGQEDERMKKRFYQSYASWLKQSFTLGYFQFRFEFFKIIHDPKCLDPGTFMDVKIEDHCLKEEGYLMMVLKKTTAYLVADKGTTLKGPFSVIFWHSISGLL